MCLAALWKPFVNLGLCCSSKPTGGANGSFGMDSASRSGYGSYRLVPADWMCTICDCVNFARRTSCFQVQFLLSYPSLWSFFAFIGKFFLEQVYLFWMHYSVGLNLFPMCKCATSLKVDISFLEMANRYVTGAMPGTGAHKPKFPTWSCIISYKCNICCEYIHMFSVKKLIVDYIF